MGELAVVVLCVLGGIIPSMLKRGGGGGGGMNLLLGSIIPAGLLKTMLDVPGGSGTGSPCNAYA